ncbi:STAS domain-containing protein [Paludisphaera mucosa]|uniref:STAS domain-containing protein n=1 Tax=Paludisphaera mucosa TaxID=3030827 RepID=A0ABT6FHA8_9BACT|nr:STAS domain-containing protein [Paludisphaera mucosa]MDG3006968.1 STAS domain-containing protein [Paludisphaera mucosa]
MPPSPPEFELLSLNMVGDVAVAQVTTHELRFPNQAQALSYELGLVVGQDWAAKTLIDLSRVQYVGSTTYAVLVGTVKRAAEMGHLVKLCGLAGEVRVGADIIGLDRIAEIYETEAEALAAFAAPPTGPAFAS